MKKLIFITLILFLQSFSSYGDFFGKGLICECKKKYINEKVSICNYAKDFKNPILKTAYDYNWHRAIYFQKNKLTVTSFYVDKDIIKEKKKISDFNTNEDLIYWGIEEDNYLILRTNLMLSISKLKDKRFVFQCKMYDGFKEFNKSKLLLLDKLQTNYDANLKNNKI